jgi:hypothetical protein
MRRPESRGEWVLLSCFVFVVLAIYTIGVVSEQEDERKPLGVLVAKATVRKDAELIAEQVCSADGSREQVLQKLSSQFNEVTAKSYSKLRKLGKFRFKTTEGAIVMELSFVKEGDRWKVCDSSYLLYWL